MEYQLPYQKKVLNNGLTLAYRTVNSPDVALSIRINQGIYLYLHAKNVGLLKKYRRVYS